MSYDIHKPGKLLHSAKGSAYGYLYQIIRALYWLSLSPEDSIVAIETDDDVVIQLNNGNTLDTIFEQDKASTRKKYPFSDKNKNLWKTLTNWLELIQKETIEVKTSRFLLVTNISSKSSSIMKSLKDNNDRSDSFFEEIYSKLKVIADNENSKKNTSQEDKGESQSFRTFAHKFLKYDKLVVISLLKRIELCDSNLSGDHLKKSIISQLRLNLEGLPSNELYYSLYGWLVDTCCELWMSGQNAVLGEKDLWKRRDFWVKQFDIKPFIEKASHLIPITKEEQDSERNSHYIKQLNLIQLEDEEKINAILDFLRAKKERSNYAIKGNVTSEHFKAYEGSLIDNWQHHFNTNRRLNKSLPQEDVGYKIYMESTLFKGKLAGVEPIYSYLSKGTYHKLAGLLIIGWHPMWQEYLKEKNDE